MDAGIDEECAENVENPFEPLHQCRADKIMRARRTMAPNTP